MLYKVKYGSDVMYYKDKECQILHREDGPAIEWSSGPTWWFFNGKCHRIDGPAINYYSKFSFFLHGVEYSEKEYWKVIKLGAFA